MQEQIKNGMKVESTLNRDDGSLPFGYYNPETDGKLVWMCGEDAEGKITSVWTFDYGTHKDKRAAYLETIEQAREARDELIAAGWKKVETPEMTFTYPGEKEERPLNRQMKRNLQRTAKKMQKNNPFKE